MKKHSHKTISFSPELSVRLKDVIGAGAFSQIYSTNKEDYVVKLMAGGNAKAAEAYSKEKMVYSAVKHHSNILNCFGIKEVFCEGSSYYAFLLEKCAKGSLIDFLQENLQITLNENIILEIIEKICLALTCLHSLSPPIIHRDVKLENVLIGNDGDLKVCDFGSCTKNIFTSVTKENRDSIQEDIDMNTTPNYRAPEQCELYSGFPIGEKVDVWALGCVFYSLCYQRLPFEGRLAVVNSDVEFPKAPIYSSSITELLKVIFTKNPQYRPSSKALLEKISGMRKNYHMKFHSYSLSKDSLGAIRQTAFNSFDEEEKSYIKSHKGKKTSLFDVCKKYYKKLTKKTEAWLHCVLEPSDNPPKAKYLRMLVIKAWKKPVKINKFYNLLYSIVKKNLSKKQTCLKALLLLHNYLKKGPFDVYLPASRVNTYCQSDIILLIENYWQTKLEVDNGYFIYIILGFCKVLKLKLSLSTKYSNFIEGNFSIKPFIRGYITAFEPIPVEFISRLIEYGFEISKFSKLLCQQLTFHDIQSSILLSFIDEQYGLISLLCNVVFALKKSTDFLSDLESINQKRFLVDFQIIEENFEILFLQNQKGFEKYSSMRNFESVKNLIPSLDAKILELIKSIALFQGYDNKKYTSFLIANADLMGVEIPTSYGELFPDIDTRKNCFYFRFSYHRQR